MHVIESAECWVINLQIWALLQNKLYSIISYEAIHHTFLKLLFIKRYIYYMIESVSHHTSIDLDLYHEGSPEMFDDINWNFSYILKILYFWITLIQVI